MEEREILAPYTVEAVIKCLICKDMDNLPAGIVTVYPSKNLDWDRIEGEIINKAMVHHEETGKNGGGHDRYSIRFTKGFPVRRPVLAYIHTEEAYINTNILLTTENK